MIIEKSPIKIISYNFISVIVAGASHTTAPHPPLTHRETARDTIRLLIHLRFRPTPYM